ncbi:hypothetical protein CQJ94_16430 [Glycomyces fuscus]|nr:hypothetical protein CQJ94_16430 [Glycomyces fuscus]
MIKLVIETGGGYGPNVVGAAIGGFAAVVAAFIVVWFDHRRHQRQKHDDMKRSVLEAFVDACYELDEELLAYPADGTRLRQRWSRVRHRAMSVRFLFTRVLKDGDNCEAADWFRRSWNAIGRNVNVNNLFETSPEAAEEVREGWREALQELTDACHYWASHPVEEWQNATPPVQDPEQFLRGVRPVAETGQRDGSE